MAFFYICTAESSKYRFFNFYFHPSMGQFLLVSSSVRQLILVCLSIRQFILVCSSVRGCVFRLLFIGKQLLFVKEHIFWSEHVWEALKLLHTAEHFWKNCRWSSKLSCQWNCHSSFGAVLNGFIFICNNNESLAQISGFYYLNAWKTMWDKCLEMIFRFNPTSKLLPVILTDNVLFPLCSDSIFYF